MDYNLTQLSENCTEFTQDNAKGMTLLFIFTISMVGNITTIALIGRLKVKRIPDVLIMCLAITDLLSTLIPIPMAIYAYFVGESYGEHTAPCDLFGFLAQLSRFTAAIVVTLISIDRYLAIAFPVFYKQRIKLWHMVVAILFSAALAFILAAIPLTPSIHIVPGDAICLFSFLEYEYASVIVVYSVVQFMVVLYCFSCTIYILSRIYLRRRKMTRQGNRNVFSEADYSSGPTFTKPGLQGRLTELNKAVKRVAPKITESLSLSIEAQFGRMMLCVTILFYFTWLPTVALIVYAMAIGMEDGCTQKELLFWAIRFTVISTAINPILYGLLCRQYRQLYIYLFRLVFHRCLSCLHEPYYSPFQHRDQVPKEAEERMRRAKQQPVEYVRYYGSYHSLHSFQSQLSTTSKQTTVTRVTTRTNISIPPMRGIEEEFTSTHLENAGAIESSVAIPESARNGFKAKEPKRSQSYSENLGSSAAKDYFNLSNTSQAPNGDVHRLNPGYNDSNEDVKKAEKQGKKQESSSGAYSASDDEGENQFDSNFTWISPTALKSDGTLKRDYSQEELELLGRVVKSDTNEKLDNVVETDEEQNSKEEDSDLVSDDDEEEGDDEDEEESESGHVSEESTEDESSEEEEEPQTHPQPSKSPKPAPKNEYNFDNQFDELEKMLEQAASF